MSSGRPDPVRVFLELQADVRRFLEDVGPPAPTLPAWDVWERVAVELERVAATPAREADLARAVVLAAWRFGEWGVPRDVTVRALTHAAGAAGLVPDGLAGAIVRAHRAGWWNP